MHQKMRRDGKLSSSADSSSRLYAVVKKTVSSAIRRAMQVAGRSENASPCRISQQSLAEQSGVARSTIAKYLRSSDDENSNVNPDLKTLCRLADTLNVSPAMLLLTPDDWSRLAQAAVFLREAASNEQVNRISAGMAEPTAGPVARATAGLQLARLFGVYRELHQVATISDAAHPARNDLIEQQFETIERQRIGIFVATSIPPLRALSQTLHAPILSLCANFGASTHPQ